jgi:hypothetical protein
LTGKKIVDARQQGKYFWMEMDSPPHPLMLVSSCSRQWITEN